MKKVLIIIFTLITLFSVVLENYQSFFVKNLDIELTEKGDVDGKDTSKIIEKDDVALKEKCFSPAGAMSFILLSKSKFYLIHSYLLPAPFTSLLEIPPERV